MNYLSTVFVLAGASQLLACGQGSSVPHKPPVSFQLAAAPRLPLRVGADLVIKRAQFGILATDAAGDEKFVATKEIPAEDGQTFGWVVAVDTTRQSLHWQEHLKLPGPPADWGDAATDPDIVIANDGRTVVAEGDDLVEDGELSRFYWALAPGDPAGDYEMDIAIEGRQVGHFAFNVPEAVVEKSILVRHLQRRGARAGASLIRVRHETAGAPRWK